MDNKKVLLGMLAILLVFGFMLTGCEYGDPGLEGTWKNTSSINITGYSSSSVTTLTFTAGDYESKSVVSDPTSYTRTVKGTYVASNGLIGFTITSTNDTRGSAYSNSDRDTSTVDYVIYGNTLLLGSTVYTKQ
jgi:hypothetical protein